MFGGGKARTEQLCLTSWFSNWNCQQREKFIFTLASQISGPSEEDLLLGMTGMGLAENDGPEMFDCQLKLVTSWWKRWSPQERSQFLQSLAVSWPEVGDQLRGRGCCEACSF
eukprot:TRINITY_DN4582_c0_g1_i1.p1 TRINITY_DN4582_c0_g1~~TRINITY_DN4582_c0_g1_i1.p1  ORF type:complete len:123 (-),score=45.90 TRINITY_DN4582_c0_g1_i1:38-373(-)